MLFHVAISVSIPHELERATVENLGRLEHERAAELQRQGKWKHLWRIAGSFANISIFNVDTPGELHSILESLPLYPFMRVEVTALCKHPGAIADDT